MTVVWVGGMGQPPRRPTTNRRADVNTVTQPPAEVKGAGMVGDRHLAPLGNPRDNRTDEERLIEGCKKVYRFGLEVDRPKARDNRTLRLWFKNPADRAAFREILDSEGYMGVGGARNGYHVQEMNEFD